MPNGQILLTFAIPCYNSAEYMDKCIDSLLEAGDDTEIILIDDGSTDRTPEIADSYAAKYPEKIRVIHQENGGHGEGVNQGLRHASGLFYKVVDSDDRLDKEALQKLLARMREHTAANETVDMYVCNYVYDHWDGSERKVMRYNNVFPEEKMITWDDTRRFLVTQYLMMHSVIYRTEFLRGCGITLPKHTFYVDNLYMYQPFPYVKTLYLYEPRPVSVFYRTCRPIGHRAERHQAHRPTAARDAPDARLSRSEPSKKAKPPLIFVHDARNGVNGVHFLDFSVQIGHRGKFPKGKRPLGVHKN